MGLLDGRVALITGASRGIGAATARALAAEGARLGLASRSGSDLGIAGALAQPADVRDPAAMRAIAAATAARFGGIDILVINAGVGAYGPFLELPDGGPRGDDRHQRQGRALLRPGRPALAGQERRTPTW